MRRIVTLVMASIVFTVAFVLFTPISFVPAEMGFSGSLLDIGLSVAFISNYALLVVLGLSTVAMGFGYTISLWMQGNKTNMIPTPQLVVSTLLLFGNVTLLGLAYMWVLTTPM